MRGVQKIIFLLFIGGGIYYFMGGKIDMASTKGEDMKTFMAIRGTVEAEEDIKLSPFYIVRDSRMGSPDHQGPYILELQDGSGALIASYGFGMERMSIIGKDGSDRRTDSEIFSFGIPFDDKAQQVNIKRGKKILKKMRRSKNEPVLAIKQPEEGSTISGKTRIQWTGTDADGDDLYYYLELSPDDGRTWEPLSDLTRELGLTIDADNIASSPSTVLSVSCTDGFNTTRAQVKVTIKKSLRILNTRPDEGDGNVPLNPYLFVIFESNIIKGEVNKKTFLLLEKGSLPVEGEVSYLEEAKRATFIPKVSLKPRMNYTARIQAGIKDSAGNILEKDFDWNFTTRSEEQ